MAQYKTGTVTVNNGSATVTGAGTAWLANAQVGNSFKIQRENAYYHINSVDADGTLTISPVYAGTNKAGASYVLARDFTEGGFYELSPNDVDWAFFVTLNMRMIAAGTLDANGSGKRCKRTLKIVGTDDFGNDIWAEDLETV